MADTRVISTPRQAALVKHIAEVYSAAYVVDVREFGVEFMKYIHTILDCKSRTQKFTVGGREIYTEMYHRDGKKVHYGFFDNVTGKHLGAFSLNIDFFGE
jgi:hypothetical protein